MAGTTLDLEQIIDPDDMASRIVEKFLLWTTSKREKELAWKEVREYVYATDTRHTTNAKLPWKNSTTLPKLCQIRDNLVANYEAALFPRRKWLTWEGDDEDSENFDKVRAIKAYMNWATSRPQFKKIMKKLLYDYIDYGNVFGEAGWRDETREVEGNNELKTGYIGPVINRINPLDHVFNPTASEYEDSPTITRTFLTMGELKKRIEKATPDEQERMKAVFDYVQEIRGTVAQDPTNVQTLNEYYKMDGFDSFSTYLASDYVELLTFKGDLYDVEAQELKESRIITIVDRHKVLSDIEDPSLNGRPTIRHVGWRVRQDNLWAMGPLDNLIGMQYRLDHIENLKADMFDFTVGAPLKIRGYVEEFEWGPMEKIYVGDDGDVELMGPDTSILNSNLEIAAIEQRMEELAGAPREAAGFRTPGEKTAFEVQRLENAASRIFQHKIMQFEEIFLEPLLNDMLEQARRHITESSIRVFDDELQFAEFIQITPELLNGVGRVVPVAARHFAEKATQVQNINEFYASALGQDPEVRNHFSSFKFAKMAEQLLDIEEFQVVQENVRLGERADVARQSASLEEQVSVERQTPSGITPDDFDDGLDSELADELLSGTDDEQT